MAKGPDAFRTISEVAEWLDVPTHVLRFWESRFTQVKPVKRAGGRRYYRPADMQLLGGIKRLLHDEGLTIRGVQKLLREEGVRHVAALSPPVDAETWEPASAKVITLNPARPPQFDDPAPDRWPFTDDAEEAVDTLAAYLDEESSDDRVTPVEALPDDPTADSDDSAPEDDSPAIPDDIPSVPEEAPADAEDIPAVAEEGPASADYTEDVSSAEDTAAPPAEPEAAALPPSFDEDAVAPGPVFIAPLAAMGRSARLRHARTRADALARAADLARRWDARAS